MPLVGEGSEWAAQRRKDSRTVFILTHRKPRTEPVCTIPSSHLKLWGQILTFDVTRLVGLVRVTP